MKKFETTNTFVTGVFPDTVADDSTGAATQDGFEYISANLNNAQLGPLQAVMDYAAGSSNPDVGTVGVPNGVTEAAGSSQLIEAIHKGFGIGPGVYKPYGKFLDPSVTGDRILILSNQGVLISSFPELVAATYVGDGNNATAPYFYKSTLADGVTRNIAGPFFILPPANPSFQKQYIGALTGQDFDITSTAPNLVVVRAVAIPYQTSDGAWRLNFNISCTHDSFINPTHVMTGVTFKTGPNQSISGGAHGSGSTAVTNTKVLSSSGTVQIQTSAAQTASSSSGDVELDGEPTWANGHTFPWGITY